ncbi:MAG: sigma-70 family RNA polymerase sigma factor [Deltaproteobacteria bacterium]|nr:sigma-70 family RNA polymerase sigma factor [Deltaproteobacteria bacterium]
MNGTSEALSRGRQLLFSLDRKKELKVEFKRVALPQLSHLYTSAFYLTKDKAEAEDLVQETYIRALRFFDKFKPGTNCRAWLLTILRNLFINRYRQKRQEPEKVDWERIEQVYESMVEQGEKAERDNPENHLISQLMDEEVERALRELPEEYRMAIVLVDIEELSYEEAAKVMECAIGTVRSRISRGRRILQVALRNYALERGLIKE